MPQIESSPVKKSRRRVAEISPAGLRARDAARFCGVSSATWARLVASGKAPRPIKLVGVVLWPREWLTAWLYLGAPNAELFNKMLHDQQGWN